MPAKHWVWKANLSVLSRRTAPLKRWLVWLLAKAMGALSLGMAPFQGAWALCAHLPFQLGMLRRCILGGWALIRESSLHHQGQAAGSLLVVDSTPHSVMPVHHSCKGWLSGGGSPGQLPLCKEFWPLSPQKSLRAPKDHKRQMRTSGRFYLFKPTLEMSNNPCMPQCQRRLNTSLSKTVLNQLLISLQMLQLFISVKLPKVNLSKTPKRLSKMFYVK